MLQQTSCSAPGLIPRPDCGYTAWRLGYRGILGLQKAFVHRKT